jgi:hypothetical protein
MSKVSCTTGNLSYPFAYREHWYISILEFEHGARLTIK